MRSRYVTATTKDAMIKGDTFFRLVAIYSFVYSTRPDFPTGRRDAIFLLPKVLRLFFIQLPEEGEWL
jgi:hypothetical protein